MQVQHYILACDDRGSNNWPSSSKTWTFGGFIIAANQQESLQTVWNEIKYNLCGTIDCELKWRHFFEQSRTESNPLKSEDSVSNRIEILWALSQLFEKANIVPATVLIRKDRASPSLFTTSKKGHQVLQTDIYWTGVIAQFALFLGQKSGSGEIWIDRSGSTAEDKRKQELWTNAYQSTDPRFKAIAPEIKFFDSKDNLLIQIADFISGALWAASENDDVFLSQHLNNFFPNGLGGYNLVKIV